MHFDWQAFESTLCNDLGVEIEIKDVEPVSGGDISRAFKLTTNDKDFFVKLNRPDAEQMFRIEWSGLAELDAVPGIRVPEPMCVGRTQNAAYFVMEFVDLVPEIDPALAGAAVADLHGLEHTRFGWDQNNFIGATVQQNSWHAGWAEFYWNCRLEPQLVGAIESGFSILEKTMAPLHKKTMELLEHHYVVPSLLHGDLWQGNIALSTSSEIVLYDPAVYWGDPETDIAATRLFNGFSKEFYQAYYAHIPLQDGAEERLSLYQLYHWLNHLNQFGQSYLDQTLNCISELYASQHRPSSVSEPRNNGDHHTGSDG